MQTHKVKILVIRFSSIGDIVLTTPVLRCLKNQLEGEVEIDYLTKKQYKLIVANNPNVNKVYCEKCDLVFDSREKFSKHLDSHSSGVACEMCPVDIAIGKFVNLFKRKFSRNLE